MWPVAPSQPPKPTTTTNAQPGPAINAAWKLARATASAMPASRVLDARSAPVCWNWCSKPWPFTTRMPCTCCSMNSDHSPRRSCTLNDVGYRLAARSQRDDDADQHDDGDRGCEQRLHEQQDDDAEHEHRARLHAPRKWIEHLLDGGDVARRGAPSAVRHPCGRGTRTTAAGNGRRAGGAGRSTCARGPWSPGTSAARRHRRGGSRGARGWRCSRGAGRGDDA